MGASIQVLVQLTRSDNDDGTWLDAEVSAVDRHSVELLTSFARFRVEPAALCRWPLQAPTLTRRELASCFSATTAEVTSDLKRLVKQFDEDPQLRKVPQEQLNAYGNAVSACADKVAAMAALLQSVAQDLSVAADRSLLVVGQPVEATSTMKMA